ARVPRDHVVGEVGEGWRVALTTLAFERRFGAMARPSVVPSGGRGGGGGRGQVEPREFFETYKWYPQRAGRPDLVVAQAQATGMASDPVVRQEIARLHALQPARPWPARRGR